MNGNLIGPNFVGFIADTIGESQYWDNTTILVTWDDWGGWFDHVTPPHTPNDDNNSQDPYQYGYRVPLLVISPYLANPHAVDHVGAQGSGQPRTQAAILRYIESTLSVAGLGTADGAAYTDDLHEMFNYKRQPIPYTPSGAVGFPAQSASDCLQPADGQLDG
jgi:phospholipase C